ncbi:hypothetical protein [Hathewaya massiliensis]|uniref:hypothetical protein n=1 Tax=Hathewaya massiliensis TaxID=1964382 RepID=UPI0011583450|nr:hypothetical protein [Hathewaya massiliensis]
MFKILKYNLKESLKYMTMILSVAIILFALVFFLLVSNKILEETSMGFYALITFGVFLTTFIYVINAYKNELYEERAYLTFTLPLKGWEVLGAKTILSIILFFISGLVCLIALLVIISNLGNVEISKLLSIGIKDITLGEKRSVIFGIVLALIQWLQFILTIFFSITLSKVAIKNKQVGFISFVIFMVANFLIGFIGNKVIELVPYNLDFNNLAIVKNQSNFQWYFGNIGFFIYSIIVIILIFAFTSYFLEKKVDL